MIPSGFRRAGVLAWLLIQAAAPAAEPVLLDDFDSTEGISQRWVASGPVRVLKTELLAPTDLPGVGGRMLRLEAQGPATVRRRPIEPRPAFADAERIVLRIHAPDATPENPVVFELQFVASDKRATWWRKITIDRPHWQKLDVPLRWFRPGSQGPLPKWAEIDQYGLHLRQAGELEIDGVELVPGERPGVAYLSPADIARAAFGDRPGVRQIDGDPFVIITDAPELDGEAVLAALISMKEAMNRDLPGLAPSDRPAVLVVFAEEREYRSFWPAMVERFNGQIAPPTADGFTALGIATTSYSAQFGKVRPVYVHEACHALLAHRLRIDNRGEWLHEGFAVRYALPYARQDQGPLVRQALGRPAMRHSFDKLLTGQAIPTNRYWQAASVIEWLLDDPDRSRAFLAAIQEMSRTGSTDLGPLSSRHFGQALPDLETAWLKWAQERYGP